MGVFLESCRATSLLAKLEDDEELLLEIMLKNMKRIMMILKILRLITMRKASTPRQTRCARCGSQQ